jgi:hypothetical protein
MSDSPHIPDDYDKAERLRAYIPLLVMGLDTPLVSAFSYEVIDARRIVLKDEFKLL